MLKNKYDYGNDRNYLSNALRTRCEIRFDKNGENDLANLEDEKIFTQISSKLSLLQKIQLESLDLVKLTKANSNRYIFRIKSGNYRIIFELINPNQPDAKIVIMHIKTRGKVQDIYNAIKFL